MISDRDREFKALLFAPPDPKKVRLRLDGDNMIVAFPFNRDWVEKIKRVSIRKWDPDYSSTRTGFRRNGAWIVPYSDGRFQEIVTLFGSLLEIDPALVGKSRRDLELHEKSQEIKAQGDAEIEGYSYVTKPYAHQRMGHKLLLENPAFGLLWEQGTGKTKSIIDDLLYRKLHGEQGPWLVICPNEVKAQWKRQVPLHSGGALSVEVLDPPWASRHSGVRTGIERMRKSKADILILNCEALPHVAEELKSREWAGIIVDEATRFKNPQALRTKVLLKLRTKLRRVLTGTPVTNSPLDAFTMFQFLSPSIFGSMKYFKGRYCVFGGYGGYEIIAFQHLDELAEKIAPYSSRVLKKDVLDLPPKTYYDNEVLLEGEVLKHYMTMRDELRTWWNAGGEQLESKAKIALTQLLRLAQIAGGLLQQGEASMWIAKNPKLEALRQIVEDLPATEKIVVYGVYQRELEEIAAAFPALRPGILYGATPRKEREKLVEEFQSDPTRRMLVGQIHSGGIGIDLFAAQTVVYYTRSWSLEDYLQSQDRLHRIGQTGTVNVIHLVAKLPGEEDTSIDEAIAMALARKQQFADKVTGDVRETARDSVTDIRAALALGK